MSEVMLVRLKPYDRSKGHLRQFYRVHHWAKTYKAGDWHRESASVADWLRRNCKASQKRGAPPAFDVYTEEGAREVQNREKMERLGRTIDTSKPLVEAPPDLDSGESSLAHDFNVGEPEHELELAPDPTASLLDKKPQKKPGPKRKPAAKKKPRGRKPSRK